MLLLCMAGVATAEQAPVELNAAARQLVQRLVLDRAATMVALQRRADAREQLLLDDLGDKDRRLRAELRQRRAAESELAKVTSQRERLIQAIAQRDVQFDAEISSYRLQMVSLAESEDPRKRAALEAYANGDRAGALDALIELQRADTRAVAAGWRAIGALALDRRDRGELSAAAVIAL
ncbi:MAG: hypothetical protein KDI32_13670, partial [Pseudomonadales bacterium]|nr:hypothetical protein [Pseudomonadales bacterium]